VLLDGDHTIERCEEVVEQTLRATYAALALEIVRVHHPLLHVLVRSEGARLLQQLVDQRGFPMVDVGDDREVAQGAWHELDFENEARDSTLSA